MIIVQAWVYEWKNSALAVQNIFVGEILQAVPASGKTLHNIITFLPMFRLDALY